MNTRPGSAVVNRLAAALLSACGVSAVAFTALPVLMLIRGRMGAALMLLLVGWTLNVALSLGGAVLVRRAGAGGPCAAGSCRSRG